MADARRVCLEWQAWVARAHALRKVFVSVKGIYYQAQVLGQPVTWLAPHAIGQVRAVGREGALLHSLERNSFEAFNDASD